MVNLEQFEKALEESQAEMDKAYEEMVNHRNSVLQSIQTRHKNFEKELTSTIENINKNLEAANANEEAIQQDLKEINSTLDSLFSNLD